MNSLLETLKELTVKSTIRHYKVAAGLFYTKKGFVSTGFNCNRTYVSSKLFPCIHAEHFAIHQFRTVRNNKKYPPNMMVIRTGASGTLLESKPCIQCCQLISSAGIKKVYYINEKNQMVWERVRDLVQYRKMEPGLSTTDIWFSDMIRRDNVAREVVKREYETTSSVFTKEMGRIIRELRNKQHLSQVEVARRACLSLSLLQTIEEKGTEPYDVAIVSKIKRALGSFTW